MNNLHRELAPISDAAWAQIEEETTRTLKRYLAGRRVVDVPTAGGVDLPAVGTGHLLSIAPPGEDIIARQREVRSLVELRVPFELTRDAIDDVERGSDDSDWQPAKDAAKKIAFAEDRAIFNGYREANIQGIREGTSNPIMTLPTGEVLIAGYTVYQPKGTYQAAWQPTISNYPSTVTRGSTYKISGTQFNGLSQAAGFGDEVETATNYPLVRITNNATSHVFYARTHDHSTMGVATGSATVSTNFDVPSGMETGASTLVVVANGIPSASVAVTVQ